MTTDQAKVARWYDARAEWEWNRTFNSRVEFAVTLRVLQDHLPPPPAAVLDVGGGPGRYAIELAQLGYDVTLFDLSAACLDVARHKAAACAVTLASYVLGSATDLTGFGDGTFAAVLSLGPFYHLLEEAERRTALRELSRVLAPDGVAVAAFLSRFAPARYWAHEAPERLAKEMDHNLQILETGRIVTADDPAKGWVDAYCELPEEVPRFMEAGGFRTLALVGAEGVSDLAHDKAASVPDDLWTDYVELNYRLGREPSLLGSAQHILYVGRKATARPTHASVPKSV